MPPKKSPANIAVANAIREIRKENGYTQESFAAEAGIDRSYYGAIERGEFNITLDTLMTVVAGLGITAEALFQRAKL